jgi:hypothetical protein
MEESITYVYRHRRLDNFKVFYIGIGTTNRSSNKSNRSTIWKRIVNKAGYQIEIIAENLSWEDACELEILLIKEYGRKDMGIGILCNLTDGGEGIPGIKYTKERNDKIRQFQKGKTISIITRNKISNTLKETSHFKNKKGSLHYSSKKVINTETSKVYDSIKEVSEKYNIKYTTLKQNLSGYRTNKTIFKYFTE